MMQVFDGLRGGMAIAVACSLLGAPAAQAVIPSSDRTLSAIASVNRASGRTKSLQLDLTMRVGQGIVATGELVSHPSGLARLELRGDGRVDRYLLSGVELEGTTNGQPQMQPRGYLQPFFLIQPESSSTLVSALEAFGIDSDSIGLAPCGMSDCFVFGDPRLAAPPELDRELEEPDGLAPVSAAGDLALDVSDYIDEAQLPRFWVGMQDLQVRRVDRGDGQFVVYGPMRSFGRIKVPEWFEIHEAGDAPPIRFDVERAVQVNAPAKAFNRDWLFSPEVPGSSRPPE